MQSAAVDQGAPAGDQAPFPKHSGAGRRQDRNAVACETLMRAVKSLPLTDGGVAAADILSQVLLIEPAHFEARLLLEGLRRRQAPRWHFPMLADHARNAAYRRAIEASVRPGDIVLDIGAGAGLTAMLAARAGARHVYACEAEPAIAAAAAENVRRNGLADRVTLIPKWSHQLRIGVDLPERADLVVSEIVNGVLLGEGAAETLQHAMAHLVKTDARAIPEAGALRALPIEAPTLHSLWRPPATEGFDLSAFHRFAQMAELTPNDLAAHELRALGPAQTLFEFDFTATMGRSARVERSLPVAASGVAHGVVVAFELRLTAEERLCNALEAGGHWGRTVYFPPQPRRVTPGDTVEIVAEHDQARLVVTPR